jgi:predicted NBD/HSP70 family sugar kinase
VRRPPGADTAPGSVAVVSSVQRSQRQPVVSALLNETERMILRAIVAARAATRSELSARLGLSKATLSAAMKRLSGAGLVSESTTVQGSLGRPASVYQAAESAGYALAVELGRTRVRVQAVAIDGRPLADVQMPSAPPKADVSADAVRAANQLIPDVARTLGAKGSRILRCVIAAPIKVSFDDPLPAELAPVADCVQRLGPDPRGQPVAIDIENNVSCAAIAEGRWGSAAEADTFCFLQVGVRIGLGIVNEGRLVRGGQGGAGEVGSLPFPWSEDLRPRRLGLEQRLGAADLVRRARRLPSRRRTADAAEIFAAAEAGDRDMRALVRTHAREVGEMAAAVVAILDPGLLILGGGVGQSPLLLDGVRAAVRRLTWETEIRSGTLGPDATIMGAAQLAADAALADILATSWPPASAGGALAG